MNTSENLQKGFLELIKSQVNGNSGFVDDLADLLCVSKDSAYRRLRGETPLQFDEIQKLCLHFNVSVDQFFGLDSSHVTFKNRTISSSKFKLKSYLESILTDLKNLDNYSDREVTFAAKDIPPFHLFQYEKLTKFKLYFWLQNVESSPDMANKKMADFTDYEDLIGITRSIWDQYLKIPSIEIWSDETVNIALRHIFYYYDSGAITKEEGNELLDELADLLKHSKKQAELSTKFNINKPESGRANTYKLFYNEVSISDNTVFYVLDGEMSTIITYGLLNTLTTSDLDFCTKISSHLQNIISKSSLISSVSERMRNKVFNQMEEKLATMRGKLN